MTLGYNPQSRGGFAKFLSENMILTYTKDLHEKKSPNLTYFGEKQSKLINLMISYTRYF